MKIVILYTELADYVVACFRALHERGHALCLVHWPINSEAPFEFDLSFVEHLVDRSTISDKELMNIVMSFEPDLLLCSGWVDKTYVQIGRKLRKSKTVRVLSFDNHWKGSAKQHLATALAPFSLLKAFDGAFVPGGIQRIYASKLGFTDDSVKTGFYCADDKKFANYYAEIVQSKREAMPKRFLYFGRYIERKGIFDLWEAFLLFQKEFPDWELWCAGSGEEFSNKVEAEGIRHFGFIQPEDLKPLLQQTSIYILPSHFEPWGVAVQEMAIAGFPMILSDTVGAAEAFLDPGRNGQLFKAKSVESLYGSMRSLALSSNDELFTMSEESHKIGTTHSVNQWVSTLLSFKR